MVPAMANRALSALCGALVAGAIGSAAARADDALASLPSGPKTLLAEIASDPAAIEEIAGAMRTAEEWTAHLAGMNTTMTEDQVAMLAEYLALNAPAATVGDDVASFVAALPADGRELFATTCFSCHGVVSYYLLQDRDQAGWMDVFAAPYHRRLLTGDNERETFASYASRAMPIPEDQVPDAWKQ